MGNDSGDGGKPTGPDAASPPIIGGRAVPFFPQGKRPSDDVERKPPGSGVVVKAGGGDHPNHVQRGLPLAVKQRIVVLFACFQTLTAVQKAIKAEFGLDLDMRTVQHYDCGKPKARVGRRLRDLYASTRERYIGDQASVGIAHQNHRLRLIERLVEKAETARDFAAAKSLLELAAKEMGGVLTNVSKVEHRGAVVHMSVEDARAELAARLAGAIDGGLLTPKLLEANDKSSDDNEVAT